MYTTKSILFVAFISLVGLLNYSFTATKTTQFTEFQLTKINELNQELLTAYAAGQDMIVMDKEGKKLTNPNKSDLLKLAPSLFSENRVRVTIAGRSDDDLCSTELVVMSQSGGLEGNYAVNGCSAHGWIFFTSSNCFDVALFHDAGLEAPYGSSVHGSVDWTFQFNQNSRISGTYMDMGAANMFKVASPCYNGKNLGKSDAYSASKEVRKGNLGVVKGY